MSDGGGGRPVGVIAGIGYNCPGFDDDLGNIGLDKGRPDHDKKEPDSKESRFRA